MKYMEDINKMQAILTKFRREVQRSEAPKCTCPSSTVYPHGGDCLVHGKSTWKKTAGKLPCRHSLWTCPICHAKEYAKYMVPGCICYPKIPGSHKDCPVHGTAGECTCWTDRGGGNISGINDPDCPYHHPKGVPTPDLPLHVRVAKALGKRPAQVTGVNDTYWGYQIPGVWKWELVPDYPNDLVAAMGALEEYCREHKIAWHSEGCYLDEYRQNWNGYFIKIEHRGQWYQTKNLPQAICEAIVKHAEEV